MRYPDAFYRPQRFYLVLIAVILFLSAINTLFCQEQKHIPLAKEKPKRDTTHIVYDTIWKYRTETLTVYIPAMSIDSFFIHVRDSTQDTVRSGFVLPIPIPLRLRDCIAPPPTTSAATVTPEPNTFLLIATVLIVFALAYKWRGRT